jgi:hypothetical protein
VKWLIILAACFAAVASAANISGNWKGTAENQGQSIQRTFTFKVDGAKLTGETNSEMLASPPSTMARWTVTPSPSASPPI